MNKHMWYNDKFWFCLFMFFGLNSTFLCTLDLVNDKWIWTILMFISAVISFGCANVNYKRMKKVMNKFYPYDGPTLPTLVMVPCPEAKFPSWCDVWVGGN